MEEQMKNSLAQSGQIALKPDQTVAGDDVNLLSKYMKENEVLRLVSWFVVPSPSSLKLVTSQTVSRMWSSICSVIV